MKTKLVKGFKGFYKVSNTGRVWSCRQRGRGYQNDKGEWHELKPKPVKRGTNKGYIMVGLTLERQVITKAMHQLVLEAFIGPCPEGLVTRHLDGVRSNNRLSNLSYGTAKQNYQDQIIHGTNAIGERNGASKLTKSLVHKIRKWSASGNYTQQEIADHLGISSSRVSLVASNKSWSHV